MLSASSYSQSRWSLRNTLFSPECPRITYFTPTSVNIAGEISPVKAPSPRSTCSLHQSGYWNLLRSITGNDVDSGTQEYSTSSSSVLPAALKCLPALLPRWESCSFPVSSNDLLSCHCYVPLLFLKRSSVPGVNTMRGKFSIYFVCCCHARKLFCLPGTPGKLRHR